MCSANANGRYPGTVTSEHATTGQPAAGQPAAGTAAPGGASEAAAIAAVAALADDLRGRLYAFIRAAGRPVTRDEAAAEAGISRKLAAFHLDKLVAAGLLRPGVARGSRRVGRAAKTYAPAEVVVQVTIPPRQHVFLAELLLDTVLAGGAGNPRDAAFAVAAERGRALGAAERRRSRSRPGRLGAERALALTRAFLVRLGFEPAQEEPGRMLLRNCPFQPLASRAPDLVCGINHALLAGFLDGLGTSPATAVLRPRPGACCVEIRAAAAR